ncbi:polyprenyl synthetase family protein [Microbacterium sp. YJN-G]|uniref:polyprenyl synthetase family protein n=1 Tax=Microbacterium sp. YJN-G TaxID=2763257 RepID=UPI001877A13E|nr:polyprenyl synthetase family protein [Microbacterium sp. YJN-G]
MSVDTAFGIRGLEETIDRFFAERILRAEELGGGYAQLWRFAHEATTGGKRVRPRLLILAHERLGGGDTESALRAGAAFELLHTALLLHDDVLDGDLVRRGRPNLAGRFASEAIDAGHGAGTAREWGTASATLAGDLLISGAHALAAGIPGSAGDAVHRIIDDALFVTVAGEHADVGYAMGVMDAAEHDILRMMEHKTAAYSFAGPLQAGAALAGAMESACADLGRIGSALGVLYQLRDDLLGVFGDERRTGKSALGDLREGKRTLLIAFAENTPQWSQVAHLFGRAPLDVADAELLRSALIASGAAERMQALTDAQHDRVRSMIEQAALPAALRKALQRTATMCAERTA